MAKDFTKDLLGITNMAAATEQFITTPAEETPAAAPAPKEAKENKNRRIQLLLKASFYNEIKAAADEKHLSVNAYVTMAIAEFLKKE